MGYRWQFSLTARRPKVKAYLQKMRMLHQAFVKYEEITESGGNEVEKITTDACDDV